MTLGLISAPVQVAEANSRGRNFTGCQTLPEESAESRTHLLCCAPINTSFSAVRLCNCISWSSFRTSSRTLAKNSMSSLGCDTKMTWHVQNLGGRPGNNAMERSMPDTSPWCSTARQVLLHPHANIPGVVAMQTSAPANFCQLVGSVARRLSSAKVCHHVLSSHAFAATHTQTGYLTHPLVPATGPR